MQRASMDRFIDTIEWIAAGFVGIVALDIFLSVLLRSTTARKMLAATMPTKPAAIHSIVSMKRSMEWRVMYRSSDAWGSGRVLRRQGVVFGKRSPQLGERSIRVGAGPAHAVGPGLD